MTLPVAVARPRIYPATQRIVCLLLAVTAFSPHAGAAHKPTPPAAPAATDATWARDFAISSEHFKPDTQGQQGRENALNGDPRFDALLKASFHQKQWFWFDHYRFTPVADLVHTFIGVPGDAVLNDNRYVTATGCVPHDCTDLGLLWIDTGLHPASLIFGATQLISGGNISSQTHLWIFASQHLNFEDLPPDFLSNLKRWRDAANASKYLKSDVLLATLVQPNGQQVDLTYATVFYKQNQPGAAK